MNWRYHHLHIKTYTHNFSNIVNLFKTRLWIKGEILFYLHPKIKARYWLPSAVVRLEMYEVAGIVERIFAETNRTRISPQ